MILTHGANSLDRGVLPFRDGAPLVYDGKSYRSKKIGNLLMTIDFFDDPTYSYNVHNNIKYYLCGKRFNVESLVSGMGWRLATDADILYIAGIINEIKDQTGYSYNQLLASQSGWREGYRGDDLTGLGLKPTGFDYRGNLSDTRNQGWYSWSGAHATTGNGAVCFQRWENGNFSNTSRNWDNDNYLPIVFIKGTI